MPSAFGSALEYLGKTLPGVGASFDESERERRRKELEDLQRQQVLNQLAQTRYETGKREEADKALSQYQEDVSALGTIPSQLDVGPPKPELQAQMNRLGNDENVKPLERMGRYGLISGSAYNPAAKAVLDTELAQEKLSRGIGGGGGAVWSQKKALFDSDPEAMKKLSNQIDNFERSQLLTPQSANYLRNRMTTDPISTSVMLDEYVSKPEISAKTVEAQTGPKVQQKYALIAPETAGTMAKSQAHEIGSAAGTTQANVNAIPGFKPIAGTQITDDSVKKVKAAAPIVKNMNTIVDGILNDFREKGYKFTGDDAAKYNANVRYLQMLAKSEPVFNLGVITGPDLMLLEQIIPDPASLKQGMKSTVLGSVGKRLEEFKKNINAGAVQQYRVHGFEEEQQAQQSKFVNGVEYIKVQGGWKRK